MRCTSYVNLVRPCGDVTGLPNRRAGRTRFLPSSPLYRFDAAADDVASEFLSAHKGPTRRPPGRRRSSPPFPSAAVVALPSAPLRRLFSNPVVYRSYFSVQIPYLPCCDDGSKKCFSSKFKNQSRVDGPKSTARVQLL